MEPGYPELSPYDAAMKIFALAGLDISGDDLADQVRAIRRAAGFEDHNSIDE